MDKERKNYSWKDILDRLLIIDLFIVIGGAMLFIASIIFSASGNYRVYEFFQVIWFPIMIPAISLFFTAVLINASYNWLITFKHDD